MKKKAQQVLNGVVIVMLVFTVFSIGFMTESMEVPDKNYRKWSGLSVVSGMVVLDTVVDSVAEEENALAVSTKDGSFYIIRKRGDGWYYSDTTVKVNVNHMDAGFKYYLISEVPEHVEVKSGAPFFNKITGMVTGMERVSGMEVLESEQDKYTWVVLFNKEGFIINKFYTKDTSKLPEAKNGDYWGKYDEYTVSDLDGKTKGKEHLRRYGWRGKVIEEGTPVDVYARLPSEKILETISESDWRGLERAGISKGEFNPDNYDYNAEVYVDGNRVIGTSGFIYSLKAGKLVFRTEPNKPDEIATGYGSSSTMGHAYKLLQGEQPVVTGSRVTAAQEAQPRQESSTTAGETVFIYWYKGKKYTERTPPTTLKVPYQKLTTGIPGQKDTLEEYDAKGKLGKTLEGDNSKGQWERVEVTSLDKLSVTKFDFKNPDKFIKQMDDYIESKRKEVGDKSSKEELKRLEAAAKYWVKNYNSDTAKANFEREALRFKLSKDAQALVTYYKGGVEEDRKLAEEILVSNYNNKGIMQTLKNDGSQESKNLLTRIILEKGKDTEAYTILTSGERKEMDAHILHNDYARQAGVQYFPEKQVFVNREGYIVNVVYDSVNRKWISNPTKEKYIETKPGMPPAEKYFTKEQLGAIKAQGLEVTDDGKIVDKLGNEYSGTISFNPAATSLAEKWKVDTKTRTPPPTITIGTDNKIEKFGDYKFGELAVYIDKTTGKLYSQDKTPLEDKSISISKKAGDITLKKSLKIDSSGKLTSEVARTQIILDDVPYDIDLETFNAIGGIKEGGAKSKYDDTTKQLKITIGNTDITFGDYEVEDGKASGYKRVDQFKEYYKDKDGKFYTPEQVKKMKKEEIEKLGLSTTPERLLIRGSVDFLEKDEVVKRADIEYIREGERVIAETVVYDMKKGDYDYYYVENEKGEAVITKFEDGVPVGNADTVVITFKDGVPDTCTKGSSSCPSGWKEKAGKRANSKQNQFKSRQFFSTLDFALKEFKGLGYYATWFMDDEDLESWKESVDKFFAEAYLGTEYWASAYCLSKIERDQSGVAYVDTASGLAGVAAHIEATRSGAIFSPILDETSGKYIEGVNKEKVFISYDEKLGKYIEGLNKDKVLIMDLKKSGEYIEGVNKEKIETLDLNKLGKYIEGINKEKILILDSKKSGKYIEGINKQKFIIIDKEQFNGYIEGINKYKTGVQSKIAGQTEYLYKITFMIKNGDWDHDPKALEEMKFNIYVKGERTAQLLRQTKKLKKGESYGKMRGNAVVQYSSYKYDKICIKFKEIPSFWSLDDKELCNDIQGPKTKAETVEEATAATGGQETAEGDEFLQI